MGVLNEAYTFFYEWLFGSAALTPLAPFAEAITIVIATVLVCVCLWFVFKLVTSLIRIVYNFFER